MLISVFRYALEDPIIGESNGDSMHRSALKSDPGSRRGFLSWYHPRTYTPGNNP